MKSRNKNIYRVLDKLQLSLTKIDLEVGQM